MSAQLDLGRQRPSHCLAKTLLAHALAPLFLSRFCGLRGSSCTLVILDRAPALAQGTGRLGPTLSRAMTLYSPRPPSVCADSLQWSAVLEGPRAAVKPYTTRQLGSPGENARWGSGFDSPWRGGGGSPVHGLPPSSSTSCHR